MPNPWIGSLLLIVVVCVILIIRNWHKWGIEEGFPDGGIYWKGGVPAFVGIAAILILVCLLFCPPQMLKRALNKGGEVMPSPWTVCLIGSSKFKEQFMEVAAQETLKGHVVLMPHVFPHADNLKFSEQETAMMEELHLRKIDLADQVIVLNVGGYIGETTQRQIDYAWKSGKIVPFSYFDTTRGGCPHSGG